MVFQFLDIGMHVGQHVDDDKKLKLLTTSWTPPPNFVWPHSTRKTNGKEEKRYLRKEHLEKYPCVVYSESENGLFCRNCVLFTGETGGKGDQNLGSLVTKPVQRYDRLFGKDGYITKHLTRDYHKFASEMAEGFVKRVQTPAASVLNQLDATRRRQVGENRSR